jgi:hypothetical protein
MLNVPFSNALQAPEYCSAGATMANRTPNETLDALALQRHTPVLCELSTALLGDTVLFGAQQSQAIFYDQEPNC